MNKRLPAHLCRLRLTPPSPDACSINPALASPLRKQQVLCPLGRVSARWFECNTHNHTKETPWSCLVLPGLALWLGLIGLARSHLAPAGSDSTGRQCEASVAPVKRCATGTAQGEMAQRR